MANWDFGDLFWKSLQLSDMNGGGTLINRYGRGCRAAVCYVGGSVVLLLIYLSALSHNTISSPAHFRGSEAGYLSVLVISSPKIFLNSQSNQKTKCQENNLRSQSRKNPPQSEIPSPQHPNPHPLTHRLQSLRPGRLGNGVKKARSIIGRGRAQMVQPLPFPSHPFHPNRLKYSFEPLIERYGFQMNGNTRPPPLLQQHLLR